MKLILCIMFFSLLASCNEYWWTRGQPPATSEILKRASDRALDEHKSFHEKRPEIAEIIFTIESQLSKLIQKDKNNKEDINLILSQIEKSLKALEGKVSYGNRPPLHELSGQFRTMQDLINNEGIESIPSESLKLFGARVLFMLASELKVPAPEDIHSS